MWSLPLYLDISVTKYALAILSYAYNIYFTHKDY